MVTPYQPGDVLKSEGYLYDHYAVYAGGGEVIDYCVYNRTKTDGEIVQRYVGDDDLLSQRYHVANDFTLLPREKVLARAESRIEENEYNLLYNNCEHFARSCEGTSYSSSQVQHAVRNIAGGAGAAIIAGAATVMGGSALAASGLSVEVCLASGAVSVNGLGLTLMSFTGPVGWVVGGGTAAFLFYMGYRRAHAN